MVRRHPTVDRGDDVRAVGFQADVGAISQPLGIGLPGDERREDRPATDAQEERPFSVSTTGLFALCAIWIGTLLPIVIRRSTAREEAAAQRREDEPGY